MGMLAALSIVMLVVGVLIGTRMRQVVATFKALASGAWQSCCTVRIPKEADADADGDDAGDMEAALNAKPMDAITDIEPFLTSQTSSELDESADLVINKVLLHIVQRERKEAEERERYHAMQRRRGADGDVDITPEMLAQLVQEELALQRFDENPNRRRAILVLEEHGARFGPVANVADAAKAAAQAAKSNARSITSYLAKSLDIDVKSTQAARRRDHVGTWLPTAAEVAKTTEERPWQGEQLHRQAKSRHAARDGRAVLRDFRRSAQYLEIQRIMSEYKATLEGTECAKGDASVDGEGDDNDVGDDAVEKGETARSDATEGGGPMALDGDLEALYKGAEDLALTTERGERAGVGSSRSKPPSSRRSLGKK